MPRREEGLVDVPRPSLQLRVEEGSHLTLPRLACILRGANAKPVMDRYPDGVTQERLGLPELWRGVMDMHVRRPSPCSMPTGSQPPRQPPGLLV
jgi:hypothetical protein